MLIYLLKMIACSTAFYGLYLLLFQNEKMFVFNRFYLLTALIVSCIIPFVTFTIYVTGNDGYMLNSVEQPIKEQYSWNDYAMIVLATILVAGNLVLLVRFTKNLMSLKRAASRSHARLHFKGVRIILLQEPVVPYSFLNTIFLNNDEYQGQRVEKEVLEHELAHVKQKHSLDILFVELLQIFCWFNPAIYLYKRSIKINHELLADAAVIKQLGDVRSYQAVLLQRAVAQSTLALASSFNFSTTKKRMIMLTKNTNPYQGWARSITALPVLAILIFLFAERSYAQREDSKIVVHDVKAVKRTGTEPEGVKSTTLSYSKDRRKTQVKINYDDGRTIEETLSNSKDVDAFEKKYGIELPPPPPPAPPALKKKIAPPPPPPSPSKKAKIAPPSMLPEPVKKEAVSFKTPVIKEKRGTYFFAPPVAVADKQVFEVPAMALKEQPVTATKKVRELSSPIVVKDEEMHITERE